MKENFKIIKRNGKKVPFNFNNTYLAIKGGFSDFPEEYSSLDVNRVYDDVCKSIDEISETQGTITVERVSNLIESSMEKNGYPEVCQAFREYRARRAKAREVFASQPQKLVKIVENLTKDSAVSPDKRENANVDGNSAMGTMLQFGSTFSKQYALAYQLDERFGTAHNSGLIHIHDLDFAPMGTSTCLACTTTITVMDEKGTIKCIPVSYFDKLFETNGEEPEWKTPEPMFVLGRNGWTRLQKVMRRKLSDKDTVYTISTKKGTGLSVTDSHKIPVIREGNELLVKAEDVLVGDELLSEPVIDAKYPNEVINIAEAVSSYAPEYGEELVVTNLSQLCKFLNYKYGIKSLAKEVEATTSRQGTPSGYLTINQFNYIQNKYRLSYDVYQSLRIKFYNSKLSFPLLLTITPEIARFMGYIFGDGSIHVNKDREHSLYQVAFININDEIMADFYKCVDSIAPLKISKRIVESRHMGYTVCGRLLVELFFRILGYKENSANMRVPDFIMNGTDEIKYNFLSALIDTDGSVSKKDRTISYGSVCEPFVKQVLQILNSLGIDGKISKFNTKGTEAKFNKNGKEVISIRNYDTWRLTVPVKFSPILYENLCSVKKFSAMKDIKTRTYKYNGELVTNVKEIAYEGFVYDLETAEHWFVADGFVVHNCTQIPLDKLFSHGFNTGHGFLRPPKGIASYSALACIAIQSNQNDQHGGQSIPLFDYYLAPGVLQTFKKQLKQEIYDSFETLDALEHLKVETLKNIVDSSKTMNFDPEILYPCFQKSAFSHENQIFRNAIDKAYKRAMKKTDRATYQAMEALIHNLNTMHCLPASEKIWVREGEDIKLMTMEDIHSTFKPHRYEVVSLNKNTGKSEFKYITAIKASGKNRTIYDITTAAGQKLRVTDNHKMMVINNGKIGEALPADTNAVLSPASLDALFIENSFDFKACKELELIPDYLNIYNIPIKNKAIYISGEETYDISVEDNETFMTKDFIFVHNSRAGAQVPFSSINFGTDTSPEGRMVTKNFLLAENAGLGNGETPIFPISIFKVKEGVNYNPGDPNYDLLELSCRVTAKRLFPNFEFLDAPFNLQYYKPGKPETEVATMGCVDGVEIITYKIGEKLYVENFERAWNRISSMFPVKNHGASEYCDVENVTIYDSSSNGFVGCKKFIRNPDKGDWYRLTCSGGRTLLLTSDHPLHTEDKGRVLMKDLKVSDKIEVTNQAYSEDNKKRDVDEAWVLGLILCDGAYESMVTVSFGMDEMDIVEKYQDIMAAQSGKHGLGDVEVKIIERHRGKKGDYLDVKLYGNQKDFRAKLHDMFGGYPKRERHIPPEVFTWNKKSRKAFLCGMIDADGSISQRGNMGSGVQLGSTNAVLALGQMQLAQSLGLSSRLYVSRYDSKSDKIRYRVEFPTADWMKDYMASKKKTDKINSGRVTTFNQYEPITNIEFLGNRDAYSYDVETESDRFDVSGFASHNCRTRVMGNVDKKKEVTPGRGNLSFTTINLVRLGLENGLLSHPKADMDAFYKELDEVMDLVKDELLQRFETQCKKGISNFPFLMGSHVWLDSERLEPGDSLKKVLKHGTLSIGFIGLAECLKALIGQHHGESEEAQKLGLEIIGHMRERCDMYTEKYKLNFSLLATPSEGTAGKYVKLDRELFGVIPEITDRDYYTNSNHVPVYYNISVKDKIAKEAPYHALCNAGHIAYIELDGLTSSNPDAIMQVVRIMHDAGVGYGAINHPVDRDPVCGYTGIIGDTCPRCGRHEGEGVPSEVLKSLGVWTIPEVQDDNNDEAEDKVTHELS